MMSVAVLSSTGIILMPTTSYRARKLLKSGRAEVYFHRPVFTIRLLDRENGDTQPMEYKCDTGYEHIGICVTTEAKEIINEQSDMLSDEKQKHTDKGKLRRSRRNRLRYRKPRFNNRKGKISKDGFAPSIRNKRDIHVNLYEQYSKVLPITRAIFEMGQFDTQVLKALEEGKPLPEGKDYQHGEQYGYATLREAVFSRDDYKCIVCGKSAITDKAILKIHHLGYLNGDRSNRMSNLATVCTKCHTAKNHKPGGKLYGLKPKLKSFKGATFMTAVRWDMLRLIKKAVPDIPAEVTYGSATKLTRQDLMVKKTHSNDAYCMGAFHPKHRTDFVLCRKQRRNNRILEKFYDAVYIDIRTGTKASGSVLSCGRTNRSEPRRSDKNERLFRGEKVSSGKRTIRKARYAIRPGDVLLHEGVRHKAKGVHNNGNCVILDNGKSVSIAKVKVLYHIGGWATV